MDICELLADAQAPLSRDLSNQLLQSCMLFEVLFHRKKISRNLVPSLVLLHNKMCQVPHTALHRYCKDENVSM